MFYHIELTQLSFSKDVFEPLISHALSSSQWKKGFDQNGILWNVEELDLNEADFPILSELALGLNNEFKRPFFFISKVLPGGLCNHIDHRKWANLAIPLCGPFQDSPINFLDPFNHIVEQVFFRVNDFGAGVPVIFNTRMLHSVSMPLSASEPRLVLMMNLYDWPDLLFKKVKENRIWNSTKNFVWNN